MNDHSPLPSQKKSLIVYIRESLLLGLLGLAPLGITLWILISIIGAMDQMMNSLIPNSLNPRHLFGFDIPGLGIIFTFLLLVSAGSLARTFLGTILEQFWDSFFKRIPFLGSLYKTARQVSTVFFSKSSTHSFKRVVYVPFPAPPAQTLAFVTGPSEHGFTSVYVPTAPNPTSGYVVNYPDSALRDADINIEAALKIILSCGAVTGEAPTRK
jgi:uncharacterized membrane protein